MALCNVTASALRFFVLAKADVRSGPDLKSSNLYVILSQGSYYIIGRSWEFRVGCVAVCALVEVDPQVQ